MRYLVRVQLNEQDGKLPAYGELHEHMEAAGFRRFVLDRHGDLRRLPRGTYVKQTTVGIRSVETEALQAACMLWDHVEVVTAEAVKLSTVGLVKASVAEALAEKSDGQTVRED